MRFALALVASALLGAQLSACASAPTLFAWQPIDRKLSVEGRALFTAPPVWTITRQEPLHYEFRFPNGALAIIADSEPMSQSRAARGVNELLRETEGAIAARTPATSFSIEHDELMAQYQLPDGKALVAFHRTFACAPLHCHVTMIQTRGSRLAAADLANALLGLGATVAEGVLRPRTE